MITEAIRERTVSNNRRDFMRMLRSYPETFHKSTVTHELVSRFNGQIETRIFSARGHPEVMLVPMADNYNHANVKVSRYLINV